MNPPSAAAPSSTQPNPPSPSTAGSAVRRVLRQIRRLATTRACVRTGADIVLTGLGWFVAGAIFAALTLRGDIAAAAAGTGALLTWAGLVGRAIRRHRRQHATLLHTARTVARTSGPLSRAIDPVSRKRDAATVERERLLRHELLGAFELAEAPSPVRSPALVDAYVEDVAARLRAPSIDLGLAIAPIDWRPRSIAAAVLGIALGMIAWWPTLSPGLPLLIEARDGRPPEPPEPVWSTLNLRLDYPVHTGRPSRDVPNPSGALRVPAGTSVQVSLVARRPARSGRIVLAYDPTELSDSPAPQVFELQSDDPEGLAWTGSFQAAGAGAWTLVLFDDDAVDEEDVLGDEGRRSAALPLELEPDRAPDIELLPLPRAQQEVRETDQVDVRFVARDDFGLVSAELVYQLPDGKTHRLPARRPGAPTRTWRDRYTWNISEIPISERSEVLYWIEVRDNDPGLGLDPLPDPPGKVTRSATMRLVIQDDEAEHAANIVKLAEIRDAAVDLLAVRMMTRAFDTALADDDAEFPLPLRAAEARDILQRSSGLLANLAAAVDALSVDAMSHERDVGVLVEVHKRLMKLHRDELRLHEKLPPESERVRPTQAASALASLGTHNRQAMAQLEDEIIRLDDLVDGQIIERLEALVARLEATQRKLVELLEQLKAGDESVRGQIAQLEQRRREDLRRIAEARAMLRQEVEEEFMNLDAFKVLEQMARDQQLEEMLRRGEIDQALEQARGELGEVQSLRDQVQQRVGAMPQESALSEEDRKRMQLLRELSLLQDEQNNLQAQTRRSHEHWRERVSDRPATDQARKDAKSSAESLQEALERINDARLGRDGRRGLEDAKRALQRLQSMAEGDEAKQLDLAEAALEALQGLQRAGGGSEGNEAEGKAVDRARKRAEQLAQELGRGLPAPGEVLDDAERAEVGELQRRQQGLRQRASALLEDEVADVLPAPGKAALRRAGGGMKDSAQSLEQTEPSGSLDGQRGALQGIQEAIDSLRRGSPPPPASNSDDASTEAERDKSLRDALMEAMREQAPDGFDDSVKRYYEELLR